MSTAEEQDIMTRLHDALDGLTPGGPPAETVRSRGRRLVWRRRVSAVLAVAVVAGLGAGLPAALAAPAGRPLPAAGPPHHARISVSAPPPGAPAGEIAAGQEDGFPWSMRMTGPRSHITVHITPGLEVFGTPPLAPGQPVTFTFDGGGFGHPYVWWGPVAANVTRVTVRVPGNSLLTLHPRSYLGVRYVAVGLPPGQAVTGIAAFAGRREVAHAVPYLDGDGSSSGPFIRWLRAGDPGPPQVSAVVPVAAFPGQRGGTIKVSQGPWGVCFLSVTGSACGPPLLPGQPATLAGLLSPSGSGTQAACLNSNVEKLVIGALPLVDSGPLTVRADGETVQAGLVRAGPVQVFALTLPMRPPPGITAPVVAPVAWNATATGGIPVVAGVC